MKHFGKARVFAALVVALLAFAVTATVVSASSSVHVARHHHRHHHACHIPQRGGGDRDSDNRGGPSDGDGCM